MIYTKKYLVRRFVTYATVMVIALLVNFIIPRLAPGNPIRSYIARLAVSGSATANEELVEAYIKRFGLDKDLSTQFVSYIQQVLRGDLGISYTHFPANVNEMVGRNLPWTIGLLVTTTAISFALGNIMGALLGWKGTSRVAKAFIPFALIFSQIPYYLLAMILSFLFIFLLPIFPTAGGYTTGTTGLGFIVSVMWHSTLPALSIVLSSIGWWALSMRSLMINVLGEDYLLFAEAKGLKSRRIFTRYALRAAIQPQLTSLAMAFGSIMSSIVITEVIFAYPGLGWLLYDGIVNLDYNLIQGIVLIIIFVVSTGILVVDLINPLIDPRICYEER